MGSYLSKSPAAVPSAEMAFAMDYFVRAANFETQQDGYLPARGATLCRTVFMSVSTGDLSVNLKQRDDESALDAAFECIWARYEGSRYQISVCIRVLAFHYLMIRTRGAAVDGWTLPVQETERTITLHPCVVDTLAAIPLDAGFLLSATSFQAMLGKLTLQAN